MATEFNEQLERISAVYGNLPARHEVDGRCVDPSVRKTYQAKQMWQRHHEIVNLAAQGFKQVDIAKIVGCDPQTVSNVLGSQMPKEKLAELREIRDGEVKVRMEQVRILTDKAIQTYNEILDNENSEVPLADRKDVADKVLMNLSGLKVADKSISASVGIQLTRDEIADFKRRGIEEMIRSGTVIDVPADQQ